MASRACSSGSVKSFQPPVSYSTVLLDLDYTLFDSDTSMRTALSDALQALGVVEPGTHYETFDVINQSLWRRVETGEITPGLVSELRFAAFAEELSLDTEPAHLSADFKRRIGLNGELYPQAHELLGALAQVSTLGLITNGLTDVQRTRIERLDLDRYFDAVIISDEVGHAKPGTEIFDLAFEALGNPATESAIMVGDSLASDIAGGKNYGIDTCWYNPHGKDVPADHAPTHQITQLQQLTALVF